MSLTEATFLSVTDQAKPLTLELLVLEADNWPLDDVAAVARQSRSGGRSPRSRIAEPAAAVAPAPWDGPLDDFWLRNPAVRMLDADVAALSYNAEVVVRGDTCHAAVVSVYRRRGTGWAPAWRHARPQ